MNIKNLKIYLVLFIILLSSCEKDDFIEINDKQINKIPYANNSTLNQFRGDDFVDIKLSRKAALLEIQYFKKELNVNDASDLRLSENPVLILDIDNTPKFYEFIVLDETDKEIGTVSCFAKKEVPALIACVLPYVRDYSHEDALIFTAAYPNFSENIDTKANITRGLADSDLEEELVVSESENKLFWNNVSKSKSYFINSTIHKLMQEQEKVIPRGSWNEYYTIPAFDNDGLKKIIFTGFCGPGALAWAYRGLYSTYNNKYIPIEGDSHSANNNENTLLYYTTDRAYYTVDNSKLLKDLNEYRGTLLFEGATTPNNMDKAVREIFPNHKIRRLGKKRGVVRKAVERGHPVYLLIFTPKKGKSMHYLIAFGTKKRYTKFWIGGTHLTDSWLLVADNGATTSNHNCLPYYRNSHYLNFIKKSYARGEFIKK